tara:strand:- start:324 stop:755 length:432 start_codon:yes stop_codon:yes gene_type:complete
MNKLEKLKLEFQKWCEGFDLNNKHDPVIFNNDCVNDFLKAASKFKFESQDNCCDKTLESLLHFFLEKTTEKNYIVRKNAMFGDLVEIRTEGFERRYLHNVKILKTYKEAYDKTEEEYQNNFGKRRYSSYDSFRQVRKKASIGK